MEILIALLVALGIVTSDDAKSGKYTPEEIKLIAKNGGVTDEKLADYEKEQAKLQEEKKEAEPIIIDDSDF